MLGVVFLQRHFSIHKILCMLMQMTHCVGTNNYCHTNKTELGQKIMVVEIIIRLALKSNLT